MKLRPTRCTFTHMQAMLVLYAESLGYEVAAEHILRCEKCPVGKPDSTHKVGLAIDLILYNNGEWLRGFDADYAHDRLHNYWDEMGGAERIIGDLRHYSMGWNGVR